MLKAADLVVPSMDDILVSCRERMWQITKRCPTHEHAIDFLVLDEQDERDDLLLANAVIRSNMEKEYQAIWLPGPVYI